LKVCSIPSFGKLDNLVAIKILVVGNGGVGKSSLIRKFCKGVFTDQYKKTIGVDFLEKQHFVPTAATNATLMLWVFVSLVFSNN
jgi:GTPase SAR1 family protein